MDGPERPAPGKLFPLESVGVYVCEEKMTLNTGGSI